MSNRAAVPQYSRRGFLAAAGAGISLAAEPAILTPKPPAKPRFNGVRVFGVRPKRPILLRLAVTGQRPIKFAAEGLPQGAIFDAATGRITGSVEAPGTYRVKLRADNAAGRAVSEVRLVVGEEIALTPVMGCNTWGGWGPSVAEKHIRAAADATVRLGLADHGYSYINIDDGWQGQRGGAYRAIQPNEKFGDMRALCDYIHSLGLKAGIYSTPWITSYAGFVGGSSDNQDGAWQRGNAPRGGTDRFGRHCFAEQDARQWDQWGFDYCKYDWKIQRVEDARRMGDALRACGRDIVYELSNDAPFDKAEAFAAIGNMCRTTGDIVDVWDRSQLDDAKRRWALGVRDIWNLHKRWQAFNRPGHWNMPCPLRVGVLGGWDLKPLQPTRLTPDEQYSHISLWCLWSAPLIIGCPIERLDGFTLSLLTNDEVLALDQDPLGKQARQIEVEGGEVLIKELEGGDLGVGLFNPGPKESRVAVRWSDLGVRGRQRVRDLWRQKDLGVRRDSFSADVASHGVMLTRLSRA
jgi:alpha-galactosidase